MSTLSAHKEAGAAAAFLDSPTPAPSNHYSPGVTSALEDRALQLLGKGVQAESVASALGVSASRISQLLSNKFFAEKVSELRYQTLQEHNIRDGKYDSLEDILLSKLEKSMPLLVKPESILKALTAVNGAKRRGQNAPTEVTNQQNIVNIVLPSSIAQKFVTNVDNQVIKAGDQELLTMPSGNLLKRLEDIQEQRALPSSSQLQENLNVPEKRD